MDRTGAQIAELEAAIRYWRSEAEGGSPRAELARGREAECRARLESLRGGGVSDAGC